MLLVMGILLILMGVASGCIGASFPFMMRLPRPPGTATLRVADIAMNVVIYCLAAIALIWINTATTAKRLHDRNRSGWWAIAVLVVNRLSYVYYGLFFGLYFGVDISIAEELLLVMLAAALSLLQTWVIIELFFLIGTDGPNRFGPDPLSPAATGAAAAPRAVQDNVPAFLVHGAGLPQGSHGRRS